MANRRTSYICGFGPFPGCDINPSGQAALDLAASRPSRRTATVLPTSYERSLSIVANAVDRDQPEVVMLLGYSARVRTARLEVFARNRASSTALDVDGTPGINPIVPGAPPQLATTTDIGTLEDLLRRRRLDVTSSCDAGGYVCNYLYYQVLFQIWQRASQSRPRCLFVHIGHRPCAVELEAILQHIEDGETG